MKYTYCYGGALLLFSCLFVFGGHLASLLTVYIAFQITRSSVNAAQSFIAVVLTTE